MENGVWRTIGGRRIFIKDGEDLATAMRRSGKFKSAAKKTKIGDDRDKKLDDYLTKYKDKTEGELRRIIRESDDETEKMSAKKLLNDMKKEDENIAKSLSGKKERQDLKREAQELMDDISYLDPDEEGYEESLQDIKDRYANLREREGSEQSSQSKEIEGALKFLDKDGSEKEMRRKYMDIPEEDRVKAYEEGKNWKDLVKERESKSESKESQGALKREAQEIMDDMRFLDPDEDGYEDALNNIKERYKELRSKEGSNQSSQSREIGEALGMTDKESSSKKYADYYKREHLGEPSNYKKGDQIEFNDGYYNTIKGSIVREATDSEKKYHINSNLKGYIVRDSNGNEYVVADTKIKGRGETDKAYKKAFEEYKKKHPNTKLSYGQFVDFSEGK